MLTFHLNIQPMRTGCAKVQLILQSCRPESRIICKSRLRLTDQIQVILVTALSLTGTGDTSLEWQTHVLPISQAHEEDYPREGVRILRYCTTRSIHLDCQATIFDSLR